ncbi:MAG: hypothetical protein JST00_21005 [Deltaproteobacteria bacterium]|nr:hypothetical protein [Deltaproteobacteria bacterium]
MSLDLPASPNSEADLFARLGKGAPPVSRKPPPPPQSELELGADDFLEVAELPELSNPQIEGPVAEAAPVSVEVEPDPEPAVAAPAARAVPKTLESAAAPVPPAPNTSPLPLDELASEDRLAEKTVEIRKDAALKAAEHLADDYEGIGHTEVMVRTPELSRKPTATPTPSQALNVTAPVGQRPSWQAHPAAGTQPLPRPGSIAPVALDAAHRAAAPSIAAVSVPPQRRGMSAGAIAGLVFGAVALIGLVGAGGFAASRALSKEPVAAEESPSGPTAIVTTATSQATAAAPQPAAASPAPAATEETAPAASSPGVDVSALPSAAPKAVASPAHAAAATPATTTTTTSAAADKKAAKPTSEKTPSPAQTAASKVDPNAPLPPPGQANPSAPVAAATAAPLPAPAAAAPKSSVGNVHVDSNLRVVQVDGAFRRTQDGIVTVSCGPHRIKAGMSERTVDVPCGGTVNF